MMNDRASSAAASRRLAGRVVVAAALTATAICASADLVGVDSITVTRYHAYGDYGGGDVAFYFSPANAIAGCDGAWIAPTQPGAKNMVATMMAAKLTSNPVSLWVNSSAIWQGSGARMCKVDSIGLR